MAELTINERALFRVCLAQARVIISLSQAIRITKSAPYAGSTKELEEALDEVRKDIKEMMEDLRAVDNG